MNFNNPNEDNFAFSLLSTILYIMYTLVHLCVDIFIYIYIHSFLPIKENTHGEDNIAIRYDCILFFFFNEKGYDYILWKILLVMFTILPKII